MLYGMSVLLYLITWELASDKSTAKIHVYPTLYQLRSGV